MNIVQEIQDFNAGRDPVRLRLKYLAMRQDALAFLRGTCHLFYRRLPSARVLADASMAWNCGDLHLLNFGSYKGDNGLVYFDLNDFDEAALAPVSLDLVRFLVSMRLYAEQRSWTDGEARALCRSFLEAYSRTLVDGKALWLERDTARGSVKRLLEGLQHRERGIDLDSSTRCIGRKRRLVLDGERTLAATRAERKAIAERFLRFAKTEHKSGFFKVLDVARRVAGTGSLGLQRYVVLVKGDGSPDGNHLIDMKECRSSAVGPLLTHPQPDWKSEAHRVVEVQRRMQAVPIAFLKPVKMGSTAYVLRAMQAAEDKIELDRPGWGVKKLSAAVEDMGKLVAWAQLRSAGRDGSGKADDLIAFGQNKRWVEPLLKLSKRCAGQVIRDAVIFNAAYDRGFFRT